MSKQQPSLLELLLLILLILRRHKPAPQVPKLFLKQITYEGNAMAKVANLVFGCEAKDANPNLKLTFKATVAGEAKPDTDYAYGTTDFPVSGVALGAEVVVKLTATNVNTGVTVEGSAFSYTVPTEEQLADPVVPDGLGLKSKEFVEA